MSFSPVFHELYLHRSPLNVREVNHSKRPRLIYETWRERRFDCGVTCLERSFDSCFPFSSRFWQVRSLRELTFGRGNVFPQVLHVASFLPAVYPHSTTESGQYPVQPDFPHLMIGDKQQGPCDVHSKQKPDSKRVLMGVPR